MSDNLLVVVPEGWTEIPSATEYVNTHQGEAWWHDIVQHGLWSEVDEIIKETPLLPEGYTCVGVRIIDTGDSAERIRLWIKIDLLPPP